MKITAHWLKVAHERVRDGENEKEVLNDYGWVNVKGKISELMVDDRYGVYEIEYVKRLRGLLNETLMFLGTIDVVLTYDEVMKACKHFRLRIEKSLEELEK